MKWTFPADESARVNQVILKWLREPHDIGEGKEKAQELGLTMDAFHKRVERLRRKAQRETQSKHRERK